MFTGLLVGGRLFRLLRTSRGLVVLGGRLLRLGDLLTGFLVSGGGLFRLLRARRDLVVLGGRLLRFGDLSADSSARDRKRRLILYSLVVLHRLLQCHFIDMGRYLLDFGQFTGTTAAVPIHKLILSVLPQTEGHGLLYSACLDTGHKTAVGFVRQLGNEYAGQVVDFCQWDALGFAGFIFHLIPSI